MVKYTTQIKELKEEVEALKVEVDVFQKDALYFEDKANRKEKRLIEVNLRLSRVKNAFAESVRMM